MLGYVLENILKLAHPFAPFLTETIWQTLYKDTDSLLITAAWPKPHKADEKMADDFAELQAIATEARALAKTLGLNKPDMYYTSAAFLDVHKETIRRLANLGSVAEVSDGTGVFLTGTKHRCWLAVDPDTIRAYTRKLAAQIDETKAVRDQLETRLSNNSYVKNAPKQIVEQSRTQLAEAKTSLERLTAELERFQPRA